MKEGDRLREKLKKNKKEFLEYQLEKVLFQLELSIDKGYKGCYWGYYISDELGALLKEQNIQYTTFTDGEFEESKIWIE